jgi:hypothetical protein
MMNAKETLTKEYIIDTILKEKLGITDATTKEVDELLKHKTNKKLDQYLAEMVSLRAQLGVKSISFFVYDLLTFWFSGLHMVIVVLM